MPEKSDKPKKPEPTAATGSELETILIETRAKLEEILRESDEARDKIAKDAAEISSQRQQGAEHCERLDGLVRDVAQIRDTLVANPIQPATRDAHETAESSGSDSPPVLVAKALRRLALMSGHNPESDPELAGILKQLTEDSK